MRPLCPTSTKRLGAFLCAWGRARDGGVAVTVAVTSTVLIGILAISIDLGRAYTLSTELDNAADAYALAGATQLDQTPGACLRAIRAAADSSLANTETFASNASGSDVYIDPTANSFGNSNIRFMELIRKDANGVIIGDYIDVLYGSEADCDANAEHIEVTIDQASQGDPYRIDYAFAGLIGAATQTFPKGYAIAESADLTCGFVPMMMCPVDPPGSTGSVDAHAWFTDNIESYDYTGFGLWTKAGKQNVQWGDGNFGWLRVGNIQGAKELGEAIGMVNPPLLCLGDDTVETEPGSTTGARQAFNTRFDIWHGSLSSERGDANWQPAVNTVKGRWRADAGSCNNASFSNPDTEYSGPSGAPTLPSPQNAMGYPRDDCAYGGNCQAVDNFGRPGDGVWDIYSYQSVMHPLPTSKPYPVAGAINQWNPDWDGGGVNQANDYTVSRFEMYLWELGRAYNAANEAIEGGVDYGCETVGPGSCNLADLPDRTDDPIAEVGSGPFPQTGEYGGNQCFNGTSGNSGLTDPMRHDRRVIEILVVDCDNIPGGLKGKTEIPEEYIAGSIDLFIVEPWKVTGSEHEIYMEIIGPGNSTGVQQTISQTIVWMNE